MYLKKLMKNLKFGEKSLPGHHSFFFPLTILDLLIAGASPDSISSSLVENDEERLLDGVEDPPLRMYAALLLVPVDTAMVEVVEKDVDLLLLLSLLVDGDEKAWLLKARSSPRPPNTRSTPIHWTMLTEWRKANTDSRIVKSWRVILTVTQTSEPNSLIRHSMRI